MDSACTAVSRLTNFAAPLYKTVPDNPELFREFRIASAKHPML
jgi:hypothetical protein